MGRGARGAGDPGDEHWEGEGRSEEEGREAGEGRRRGRGRGTLSRSG